MPAVRQGHQPYVLFTEGDALYEAMLADIARARDCIRLESYIFAADEVGWRFAQALAGRATAGVDVRVHVDAAGFLLWGSRPLLRFLRGRGVRVRLFHRWRWRHPLRYSQRDHRKLLVVDADHVYLGGFNIHRENSRAVYGEARWRDTHVRISGVLASEGAALFDAFWNGNRNWRPAKPPDGVSVLMPNHTRSCRQALRCLYLDSFSRAARSLYVTTPYFVPDYQTQQALKDAARRRVDVRLLVPHKSDSWLAQQAAQAAYANLLHAGVGIYEYLPRMLHAKTVVIDGEWATLGTANLDYRSLFHNYELNLVTRDPALCRELEAQFLADLGEARRVSESQWRRRPFGDQVAEAVGWLARRWL